MRPPVHEDSGSLIAGNARVVGPIGAWRPRRAPLLALASALVVLAAVPVWVAATRPGPNAGTLPPSAPVGAAVPLQLPSVMFDPGSPRVPAIGTHPARLDLQRSPKSGPRPFSIRIPALGVVAPIMQVGVDAASDTVQIPTDVRTVGWYRFGPSPGQPGSTLLVGHVDSAEQGAGAFFRLRELDPGARILVRLADGSTKSFRVWARRTYPKRDLPSRLFDRTGPSVLTLVTCGGAFDPITRHYADNVVIYAVPG